MAQRKQKQGYAYVPAFVQQHMQTQGGQQGMQFYVPQYVTHAGASIRSVEMRPYILVQQTGVGLVAQQPIQQGAQLAQHVAASSSVGAVPKKEDATSAQESNEMVFWINGAVQHITNPDPTLTLNDYLRSHPGLTGTKKSCGEGGCGACTVMMTYKEGTDTRTVSVNSCLRPLCSMDGAFVTTIEGVKSSDGGMTDLQKELVACNGTQCGFCSSGFVMQMVSLLTNNPNPTPEEVEKNFDGNLCRCTGYRPILDAFQKFATSNDVSTMSKDELTKKIRCVAAGDLTKQSFGPSSSAAAASSSSYASSGCCGGATSKGAGCKTQKPSGCCGGEAANDGCCGGGKKLAGFVAPPLPQYVIDYQMQKGTAAETTLHFTGEGIDWYSPETLADAFSLIAANSDYRLVVGNTSTGIFKNQDNKVMVDLTRVPTLYGTGSQGSEYIYIGAANTLSDLVAFLQAQRKANPSQSTSSFPALVDHLMQIANWQVRNVGSLAGNLMMANQWGFPSDLATVLMGIGATIGIYTNAQTISFFSVADFLARNMKGSVMGQIRIPYAETAETFTSYKVAQRHANSHPYVNAAFSVQMTSAGSTTVKNAPALVFGGVAFHAKEATQTAAYLVGKNLQNNSTLSGALNILSTEIVIAPSEALPEYKHQLVMGLFYKWYLSQCSSVSSSVQSAATPFVRPVSSGTEDYKGVPNPSEFPVSEPVQKLEANAQVTGQAKYVDDIPTASNSLYAAYVSSTQGDAELGSIDASDALKMAGVVDFISAKDLKHANYCGPFDGPGTPEKYRMNVFADTRVNFAGQPVGLILADSYAHARKAAAAVKVTYNNAKPPIITLEDARAAKSFWPQYGPIANQPFGPFLRGDVETGFAQSDIVVEGTTRSDIQYHFQMETQTAVAVPEEDGGITLLAATQWANLVQSSAANVLGIHRHKINVNVKRLGGAYGSKITNPNQVACAAAVAAIKHGVPVRLVTDLSTNMQQAGKRTAFSCDYKVGVTKEGKLVSMQIRYFCDGGSWNDAAYTNIFTTLGNCCGVYYSPNVYADGFAMYTNLPGNTYMRAPELQSTYFIEHIMEHVARTLNMSPDDVKQSNFYQVGQVTPGGQPLNYFNIPELWTQIQQETNYSQLTAQVAAYNKGNRWTKQGISLIPMKYGIPWAGQKFNAVISIFGDGSVEVAHAGIESGQGINTKVAQVVAETLGCDLSMVAISATTTFLSPNTSVTGGSITSELCSSAARSAATQLADKLAPFRVLFPKASWQEIINKANNASVPLQATGWFTESFTASKTPFQYMSYGTGISQVQVDMLTGEVQILRSDILFDCGTSLNPAVDVGQVQGAFVMGIGTYMTEKLEYDADTGKLLTDGTFEYKPPSSVDIPIQLNVKLLPNAPNPQGFLSSKAVGEPPYNLANSLFYAIKHALYSARADADNSPNPAYFELDAPATVDEILMHAKSHWSQFTI